MASTAYYEWLDAGEPYQPCRPVSDFVAMMRNKGYTVYHKGDTPHMQAEPPEDHTPFSATGWPITSKRWIGHALDIMPDGPIPLSTLASRIIDDKIADKPGTQWIKYINWTDSAGATWHYSWQPGLVKKSSTDKGHIHISARSDMDTSDNASGYDPTKGLVMSQFSSEDINVLRAAALAVLQYAGRGIGENSTDGPNRSVLSYLDEMLDNGRATKTDVATMKADILEIKTAIANLATLIENFPAPGGDSGVFPTVAQISKATVDEFKDRL